MYIPYFRINKQTICSKWRRLKWRHIFQSSSYVFLIYLVAHTFVCFRGTLFCFVDGDDVVDYRICGRRKQWKICEKHLWPFPLFLVFALTFISPILVLVLRDKNYFFNIEENRYLSGISVENFKRSWVIISEFESLRSTK